MAVSNKAKDMRETRQGYTCTKVPLQVPGSDKTKLQAHGSVRARLKVKNSYKIRLEVHSRATSCARE